MFKKIRKTWGDGKSTNSELEEDSLIKETFSELKMGENQSTINTQVHATKMKNERRSCKIRGIVEKKEGSMEEAEEEVEVEEVEEREYSEA